MGLQAASSALSSKRDLVKEVFKLLVELPIGLLIHLVFIQFAI